MSKQKIIWPLSKLGDSWWEVLFVALLLIVMAPLLLILAVLLCIYAVCARVFGPMFGYVSSPKIPRVVDATEKDPEVIFRQYRQRFEELRGVQMMEDDMGVSVASPHARVHLWNHDQMVGISVDKMNSGMWHSDECDNLDDCYWTAVGALRDGVLITKSWLGNGQAWAYSRDMGVWVQTPTENASYSYVNFRAHGPRSRNR